MFEINEVYFTFLISDKYFMREAGNYESCEVVVKHCSAVPDLSFFHCPTPRLDVSKDTAILTEFIHVRQTIIILVFISNSIHQ